MELSVELIDAAYAALEAQKAGGREKGQRLVGAAETLRRFLEKNGFAMQVFLRATGKQIILGTSVVPFGNAGEKLVFTFVLNASGLQVLIPTYMELNTAARVSRALGIPATELDAVASMNTDEIDIDNVSHWLTRQLLALIKEGL